ncbi:hypothetical protein [Wenjunlia tyrosinilytica]|uniref:Uncharacterized protein n=1 Tax=Wenjunlia tyrosinilytica TaxID=1544741 RepID=A0A918E0S9_9ACTN|nr:hypothetical protein [Wenjunlia tyrosinilytica]GGO98108.1 hypothetical protein GCM10012280_61470 [Wenjunlia tyrosinilytica]GGO98159.1 hypothetical protein GCM10012280_61640 [Wenjunlia tyrosinilytica]
MQVVVAVPAVVGTGVAEVDALFTGEAAVSVAGVGQRYGRKPSGTSDQGWCED